MPEADPAEVVLVGYDGSPASEAALRWGAGYAERTGQRLRLLHVLVLPASARHPLRTNGLRDAAERLLEDVRERVQDDHPDLGIDVAVTIGRTAASLLAEARSAALVVVGSRGLGEFRDLVLGSVAEHVSAHAPGPVVVTPAGAPVVDGPVVVGVDGSAASSAAVAFGFEEAQRTGDELDAVLAWTGPVSAGPGDMLPLVYDADALEQERLVTLAEALAGAAERYPDVVVRRRVVRGHPAAVLVEAARYARLLVVGSRGRGGFPGLPLGSVSRAVLHRARCPVAVVR